MKPERILRIVLTSLVAPALLTSATLQAAAERKPNILFIITNLARDPKHREIVLPHRELLTRFGREQNDAVVIELLADNVNPIPFSAEDSVPNLKPARKAKKLPQ